MVHDQEFPTDGSFVPNPAQVAYADQQTAKVSAALDALVTEAMLSVDLGMSGLGLLTAVSLRTADEVVELGPPGTEASAAMALAATAIVRLAAAESRGRAAGYAEAVQALRDIRDAPAGAFDAVRREAAGYFGMYVNDWDVVARMVLGIIAATADHVESLAASAPSATTEEPSRG